MMNREDVKKLADLARLELSEDELQRAEKDLDAILGYVQRLGAIDTQGVQPSAPPAKTEWRPDTEIACDALGHELLLSNFPARKGDLLHTPGVFVNPKK